MRFGRFVAIILVAGLAGCASGADSNNMTASLQPHLAAAPGAALYQGVGIGAIAGGQETSPLLMSKVSDTDFKTALKNSLLQNQLHAIGPEKYTVSAQIEALDQPFAGLDMSVTSKVRYKVIRVSDKAVVYDKLVTETHTATIEDSPVGVERLKIANEGAIKRNISTFIADIAKLRA